MLLAVLGVNLGDPGKSCLCFHNEVNFLILFSHASPLPSLSSSSSCLPLRLGRRRRGGFCVHIHTQCVRPAHSAAVSRSSLPFPDFHRKKNSEIGHLRGIRQQHQQHQHQQQHQQQQKQREEKTGMRVSSLI